VDQSALKQPVSISLQPVYFPLFGFLRVRLEYDSAVSNKFSLVANEKKERFFTSLVRGTYNWQLPEIREYKVTGAVIYFEDMFQMFSFATKIPVQDNFYTQPGDKKIETGKIRPKKTESTNVRIDKIRKVEGEFLNYKNFENNDDVRRIVWKIYAKNKELVIRIPETNDPYASHIYFYASFYNRFQNSLYEKLEGVFLNHFKTITWNTYRSLLTQGFNPGTAGGSDLSQGNQNLMVRYIPDQHTGTLADDPLMKVKHSIAISQWHTTKTLSQYFKKEDASVLCVSSFTDARQLQQAIESAGKDLVVVFVRLSKAFNTVAVTDWLKWIFIRPSKDSLEKLGITWNVSPLKREVIQNEKNVIAILDKSECEKIIL
jgi:hypothetical protein